MFGRKEMTVETVKGSLLNLFVDCSVCSTKQTLRVIEADFNRWNHESAPTQDAFPYLTPPEREVLISGTCGKCYQSMFGNPDDSSESEKEKAENGRVIIDFSKIMLEIDIDDRKPNKKQSFPKKRKELEALGYTKIDEVKESKKHQILYGKDGWYIVLSHFKK